MPPNASSSDQPANLHDEGWLGNVKDADAENEAHFWGSNPRHLITRSYITPGKFLVGNGADVYSHTIIPALQSAEQEIIFVTCFWARSECLNQLAKTLIKLSEKAQNRPYSTPTLRVRLCFSSRSLTQKLFHTSSPHGYTCKPAEWVSKLGLPAPEMLVGLNLQIKSLFFLPFSVMHPKFIIIDRRFAFLPSCNLSWESWFEGCLPVTGDIVDQLLLFWKETWGSDDLPPLEAAIAPTESPNPDSASSRTITLLPHPHHRSPRFCPFLQTPKPPQTPLSVYLDRQFATAKSSIKILTPNLTCQHVIASLLAALARGINVTVIANRRMMVFEQLLTAGTITEISIWQFKRRYVKLLAPHNDPHPTSHDLESGRASPPGTLSIGYFRPNGKHSKSHLKCTIIDDERVVLGSGNMDRASWYTSQELGVAVEGVDVVREVWGMVEGKLRRGRGDAGIEGEEDWVEWI